MKFCKDCKHFGQGDYYYKCLRTGIPSLVDGIAKCEWCDVERTDRPQGDRKRCGVEAIYFEPYYDPAKMKPEPEGEE